MTTELLQQALDALKFHTRMTRPISHTNEAIAALEAAIALPVELTSFTAIVNQQASDERLWFVAEYASEAYLQSELRRLHVAIETTALPVQPASAIEPTAQPDREVQSDLAHSIEVDGYTQAQKQFLSSIVLRIAATPPPVAGDTVNRIRKLALASERKP